MEEKHLKNWEKGKIVANWVAAIAVPVVLGVSGYFVNLSIKSQETQSKLITLAIEILKEAPDASEDSKKVRRWAIDVINRYSEVKIPKDAKNVIIERRPILEPQTESYKSPGKLTTLERVKYRTAIESVGMFNGNFSHCTAWLVGADLIITADYCADERFSDLWGFRLGFTANTNLGTGYGIKEIIKVDRDAKIAILRLDRSPPSGITRLNLADRPLEFGEKVFVAHHPNGESLKISDQNCVVETVSKDAGLFFAYRCRTEGGSGGAPVISLKDGKVVGLHYKTIEGSNKVKDAILSQKIAPVLEAVR